MALVRRAHEWAADHFRFVQYPRPRYGFGRVISERSLLDRVLVWGAFAWVMFSIWGSFTLVALCVVITLVAS